jgi:hypothetical protein
MIVFIFWIGFIKFNSLSLRTFLASILGMLVPWLFFFFISFYFCTDYVWLTDVFGGFEFNVLFYQQALNEIIYQSALLVVLLMCLTGLYSNLQSDSIRTRANIMFLSVFFFGVLTIFLVFGQYYTLLSPLMAFGLVFLLSHPFSLRRGNFYSILFIVFIVVNIAFVISNILFLPT